MPIKPIIGGFECQAGSQETIQMTPTGPACINRIWSVLHGLDAASAKQIPLDASGDSFTITILPGTNHLQVLLQSASNEIQTVVVQQPPGGAEFILEDDIEINGGVGTWTPQIVGK
jgi:hypothetical protein